MSRLNRFAIRMTNGRLDALGIVLFAISAAFVLGLAVELFRDYP